MATSADILAMYLHDTHDAAGVVDFIRDRYPKSLCTMMTNVKTVWLSLEAYGEHYDDDMKDAQESIVSLTSATSVRSEKMKLKKALQKMREFDTSLNLSQKSKLKRSLRSHSFTGHPVADELLIQLRLFPDYMNSYKVTSIERAEQQKKHASSLERKSSTAWEVSASLLLKRAREMIEDPGSNAFDLACALSLLTGRRMIEIFKTAEFLPAPEKDAYSCMFLGQAKKTGKDESYHIPLHAPYEIIKSGLNRLRISKPCGELSNSEVNARYSNSCNSAAKKMLGSGRKFHDLRAAYAVIGYNAALPHKWSLNFFVCKVLGHTGLANSLTYVTVNVTNLEPQDKRVWAAAIV